MQYGVRREIPRLGSGSTQPTILTGFMAGRVGARRVLSCCAEDASTDALSAVLARAETDVAFRTLLLIEPHRAIADAFGIHVPQDFRLRFIERHSDVDALVVLPDLRLAPSEAADVRL